METNNFDQDIKETIAALGRIFQVRHLILKKKCNLCNYNISRIMKVPIRKTQPSKNPT